MMQQTATSTSTGLPRLLRTPSVTIARLTLESYFRSGWLWVEFVLALVFFAALFFPFKENVSYFYGTSIWDLSAIAILGTAIMVRQSTNARTYIILARLSTRAAYSRGLILAAALVRIPLFLFLCTVVLLAQRLLDPTLKTLLIGALGLLPVTILVSTLTVTLTSPIGTRRIRIFLLAWIVLVLFSLSPLILLPDAVINVLSFVRIPLAPIGVCYNVAVDGSLDLASLAGFFGVALYIAGLVLLAGYWLERRELLLY